MPSDLAFDDCADSGDESQWFIVPGRAVFDEHEDESRPDTLKRVTPSVLAAIARNTQARIDDTGDMCPIIIGHNEPGVEKPVEGFAFNFRLGKIGAKNPRWAILSDWKLPVSLKGRLWKFPRASCEVWPKELIIDPIALLGGHTPHRDVGLSYSRGGLEKSVHYEMRNEMLSPEDVQAIAQGLAETPLFKGLAALVEKMHAEMNTEDEAVQNAADPNAQLDIPQPPMTSPDPSNPMAPPAPNGAAPGAPMGEENADDPQKYNGACPSGSNTSVPVMADKDKPDQYSKGDNMSQVEHYRKLWADERDARKAQEQRIVELERNQVQHDKRVKSFERQQVEAYCRNKLRQGQAKGVKYDTPVEMDRLMSVYGSRTLTDAQPAIDSEFDRMERYYQRAPVGYRHTGSIDVQDGGEAPVGINAPLSKDDLSSVHKYMRDHGANYDEAVNYVKANR